MPREPATRYLPVFPSDSIPGWSSAYSPYFIPPVDVNPLSFHVGDVYMYRDGGWSLQLYGSEYAEKLKRILGELATQNGANLKSILMDTKPRQEIAAHKKTSS